MSFGKFGIFCQMLKEQFKYIPNISDIIYKRFTLHETTGNIYTILKPFYKKSIPDSTIQLFHNNPEQFFSSAKTLLSDTSFFDICGNSIFVLYFHILCEKDNSKCKKDIYEKNFDKFFNEFGNNLSLQDMTLETPLHKLIKFKNKKIFF